ncbi:peptidyl-prolyl cis-trans isomerase B (cyclophilin B) [Paenibacillus endophyticus]|uniref:Peptidyl-prolyl cis-trans isomerase n=1 Tax=Paenibacillus endophyticus TaxID=1294268 RepID=A0A7W5GAY2_9BACL|nr:peptidylprolyl isomerase [Paenibacillus endophyticus]MBB3153220.1 peptidyl-prolyl cis-trans isomerase B (cyclophilin B) [Paenibacillus endophyticus]
MLLKNKRFGMMLLLTLALVLVAAGCGGTKGTNNGTTTGSDGGNAATATNPPTEAPAEDGPALLGSDKHPVVTIQLSNDKIIKLELYPEVAPNSVNNFISLINKSFYDGVIFHRVIPGFMIQGGDPDGTGMGGPGYSIPGEFNSNGFENKLKHTRGILSMARTQDPDTGGSQFFIMVADAPSLDNEYAAFGKVTEGMEAVDEIVNQTTGANDKPESPISMKKVTVDMLGMTFEEPKKTE